MKVLNILKLVLKYGAWITVIIDIVTYASEKIEQMQPNEKKDAKLTK